MIDLSYIKSSALLHSLIARANACGHTVTISEVLNDVDSFGHLIRISCTHVSYKVPYFFGFRYADDWKVMGYIKESVDRLNNHVGCI